MPPSVLITNIYLSSRTGTEIQTRNTALALHRRGVDCVVYSPVHGPIAEEIRAAGVPVVADLDRLDRTFDVIHGHHVPATVAAIRRFPGVPALFFCHDVTTWYDAPPRIDGIHRYIAVDEPTAERMRAQGGVPSDRIQVMLNAVDLERFPAGPALPGRPRRALVFAKNYDDVSPIAQACAARGIEIDSVGVGVGRLVERPERLMPLHDVVFASALTAMEAMACGRAVVVCDGRGFAGLATPENFDRSRRLNFGLRTFTGPITVDGVAAALDAYDPAGAAEVTRRIRAEAGFERHVEALLDVYRDVVASHRRNDSAGGAAAERVAAVRAIPFGGRLRLGSRRAGISRRQPDGFSAPEPWGCWTDGERATLACRLRSGGRGDVVLGFYVKAFVSAAHRDMSADVEVDGVPLESWRFTWPWGAVAGWRRLRIPADRARSDGTIDVAFGIRWPKSPADLGLGDDPRRLGLGLSAIGVRRAWW